MEVRVRWRACSVRSRRPVLEGMEARQLLSMTMFDFVPTRRHHGKPAGAKFSLVIQGQRITSGLGF